MGAHGMRESSATFGSVAQELLRRSPVPVMIVRPPEQTDAADTPYADLQEQPDA